MVVLYFVPFRGTKGALNGCQGLLEVFSVSQDQWLFSDLAALLVRSALTNARTERALFGSGAAIHSFELRRWVVLDVQCSKSCAPATYVS